MIVKGRDITALVIQEKQIAYFYIGDKLIWQSVRSCFGAGYWVNEKPWINEEGWKN